jgi:inner membrane protein
MDFLSQAVLGASWAQMGARRKQRLLDAGAIGAVSGMAPDLDTLIRSSSDPLLFLEYHRHFTHSLLFVPFGALVCAAVLHRFVRRRLGFRDTFLWCLLGFGSHGLLDACTTYGTQLFWPLSDSRVAWGIVAAIDPMFTLPALALVLTAVLRNRVRYGGLAAAWALAYLAGAAVQHHRAETAARMLAEQRGHDVARLAAMPALFSTLLWKTIYEHDGRYYVDAVRTGWHTTVFAGESAVKLDVAAHFPWMRPGTQQALDVERFRRVADDFLTVAGDTRIAELRYSMLPNEVAPFWAIELDPHAAADEHVEFVTTRDHTPAQARRLLGMMF